MDYFNDLKMLSCKKYRSDILKESKKKDTINLTINHKLDFFPLYLTLLIKCL